VISQWIGGVCLFSSDPFKAYSIPWLFPNLDFYIIHTNTSLNTWEHLQNVGHKTFPGLNDLAKKGIDYIKVANKEKFINTINEYATELEKNNLVHKNTITLLNKIKTLKEVLAAKGCGALGADVILILFKTKHKKIIKQFLKTENIIASSKDITEGVKISFSY